MAKGPPSSVRGRRVKSLDEEHRLIRSGWPRLSAALEVARTVNKAAAGRGGSSGGGGGGGGGGGSSSGGATAATAATAAAAAVQAHCRTVLQQLECAVTEELLPHLAAEADEARRAAKRQRTDGAEVGPAPPHPGGPSPTAPSAASPPLPAAAAASPTAAAASASAAAATSSSSSTAAADSQELLGVLLRLRLLGGGGAAAAAQAGGGGGGLGGMRLHPLDDGSNVLSLPSALTAAVVAAAAGGGGGGGLADVDRGLMAAGAARLATATQVRLLLPGVLAANVLLEGPGRAAPLRVVVDAADKAFDLDPWATPSTQVFRRLSALATRVLAYYLKRAPLSAAAAAAAPGPAPPPGLPPCPASAGGAALEDCLLWLLSCRDLFSKRCAATGRLMAWDPSVQYPVPPVFRAFMRPREELRLRAIDLSRVAAYHMHVAPVGELGWTEDVPAQALAAAGLGGSTA
ncbi:hypothetical protein TSOC_005647 [Tetrabaena socialis]|uniref:Uncharacterized protein n=1 Tax=Tetrabaena socialis TaxID=47790 RepID=A0A2J8A5R1_9CHLO|nr:hypothetical protein TSOC_005647 [Tetrabaena socialis]|eukprot:PNH07864.1 hypothetical protein TSOC_005647 [Tetrabaena socialis]